jgi:hypothetical protein
MNDWLPAAVVGSLVLAGGSIVAWIKFFMDLGATRKEATSAMSMATAAHTKVESLGDDLQKYKIEAAHEQGALAGIEHRITTALSEMRTDIRTMNDRLDRVLDGQGQAHRKRASV